MEALAAAARTVRAGVVVVAASTGVVLEATVSMGSSGDVSPYAARYLC